MFPKGPFEWMVHTMAKKYPKLLDDSSAKNPLHILATYVQGRYKNERTIKSLNKEGLKELRKLGKHVRVVKNRDRGSYPVQKKLKGKYHIIDYNLS